MRIINHAMTGAIVGLSVAAPVAIPLAFFSHFALDALPHEGNLKYSRKAFNIELFCDIALCLALVLVIFLVRPQFWWLSIICAALATSPDLMWFSGHRDLSRGKALTKIEDRNMLVRLHHKVQWFHEPIGIVVEIIWLVITGVCLYFLLR
jgi:hypothetical protein